MAIVRIGHLYDTSGNVLSIKSSEVFDANTKKFLSDFITETATKFTNVMTAITSKAPVLRAATITERNNLEVVSNQLVWVLDATGDSSVKRGAALYLSNVSNGVTTYDKIAEVESLDLVVNWADIQNKPVSTTDNIDDAVSKRHEHTNKSTVDKLSDSNGTLLYNGSAISGVTGIAYGPTLAQCTDFTGKLRIVLEDVTV